MQKYLGTSIRFFVSQEIKKDGAYILIIVKQNITQKANLKEMPVADLNDLRINLLNKSPSFNSKIKHIGKSIQAILLEFKKKPRIGDIRVHAEDPFRDSIEYICQLKIEIPI